MVGVLVEHHGQVGPADEAATSSVVAIGSTSGNHARRDCFAASRAVARHRASDLSARSPRQTATDRAAAHGTTVGDADLGEHLDGELAAVALGQGLHDGDAAAPARARLATSATSTVRRRLPVACTTPGDRRAGAVGERELLAHAEPAYGDRVVGLVTGDLDRSPGPTPASDSTQWTGSVIGGSVVVEGVADAAEERTCCCPG